MIAGISPFGELWIGSEGSATHALNATGWDTWSFTGYSGASSLFLLIPFIVVVVLGLWFVLGVCIANIES